MSGAICVCVCSCCSHRSLQCTSDSGVAHCSSSALWCLSAFWCYRGLLQWLVIISSVSTVQLSPFVLLRWPKWLLQLFLSNQESKIRKKKKLKADALHTCFVCLMVFVLSLINACVLPVSVCLSVIRSAFRVWKISSVSSTMCSITPTTAPKMHSNSGKGHYHFKIFERSMIFLKVANTQHRYSPREQC